MAKRQINITEIGKPDFYSHEEMAEKLMPCSKTLKQKVKALHSKNSAGSPSDTPPSTKIMGKRVYPRIAYEEWLAEKIDLAA